MNGTQARFAPRRTALALAIGLCALLTAACNVDGAGYVYSASTPDGRFAESRAMAQPAAQNLPGNFSFIFVSDLHIEKGTHAYFRGLKDRLDGASFVVIGGDITQNGQQEDVDEFIAARATLGVPVYAVPGNHDLYSGGWARTKAFGPSSFTVKLGDDARLVCLDSANGTLGESQASWLRATLSGAKESTLIVATHMQFFTKYFLETQQYTDSRETAMLLSAYRNAGVDLILAGHAHKYAEATIGSMLYRVSDAFLNGSSGASYLYVTCANGAVQVERRYY